MEQRTVEVRQTTGYWTSVEDTARFLRELRQLRDWAGLGQAELAARAHYPHDCIRAAEAGPALPDLPVLSAYVRGCGGTIEEWEERWRSLTHTPALSLLPSRSAGCSTAATAGARIGPLSASADAPDPAAIMAALDRVAEKMAASTSTSRPSRPAPPPITHSPITHSPITQSPITQSPITQPAAASAKRDISAAPRVATSPSLASPSLASPSLASASAASGVAGTPTVAKPAAPVAKPAAPIATTIKPTAGAATATNGTAATRTSAAGASATAGAVNEPRDLTAAARRAGGDSGGALSARSRAMIAALIAVAICVIVAVLAIFA